MNLALDPRLAIGFLFAFCATPLIARLALRLEWVDDPEAPVDALERARKLQKRAVPTVGGWILLVGGFAFLLAQSLGAGQVASPDVALGAPWIAACSPRPLVLVWVVLGAFLVGLWDDWRGLAPLPKLVGQALALSPLLFAAVFGDFSPVAAVGLFALGLVSLNVLNTFDNADGALGTLGVVGFLIAVPQAAVTFLGFVPWNLDAKRRGDGGPTAYLGDAGAFVAGALVLATPHAWGLLFVPALDLFWVSVVRLRQGSRPWIGDRRHVAHRLAARGLAPLQVAALQVCLALPALLGWGLALQSGASWLGCLGFLLSGGLFLLLLRWAPASGACPRDISRE